MAAGYTYSDYVNAVAALLQYDATITNAAAAAPSTFAPFNTMLPRAIEYGEQRMYQELDFLLTRATASAAMTANSRIFTVPGNILVLEQVAPIVGGARQPPLLPMSKDMLEQLYPSDAAPTVPSVPTYFAPVDQNTILVAPPPDSNTNKLECFGTIRPAPLSSTNAATVLTTYSPSAFLACTMVFWAGYQRDFGQQSDDPKMALSWESTYQTLTKPALIEEFRKKFQSQGWSPRLPSPIATPSQT